MKRLLVTFVLVLTAFAGGGAYVFFKFNRYTPLPDPPAVLTKVKDIARLETLEVNVYKKVSFAPEPKPTSSLVGDVFEWAKFTLKPPEGRAIVFATVRVGVDLDGLNGNSLLVQGDSVEVHLPPLKPVVELHPGETEVIGSNLDSQQTAQLMDVAKTAFEREVMADPHLRERAEGSAQRAIKGLLLELGYKSVTFGPSPHT
ncbi:MAG: DUF4230 domain-containing protein [Myxococcaceae bacterium]